MATGYRSTTGYRSSTPYRGDTGFVDLAVLVQFTSTTAAVFDVLAAGSGAPVVANRGLGQNVNGDTTHVCNLPTGIAAGNLIVVTLQVDTTNSGVFGWPAGWTELDAGMGDAGRTRLETRSRTADGTEGTTITVTSPAQARSQHYSWRITGQHDASLPEAVAVVGATSTPDPPALDPTWGPESTLWLVVLGSDGTATVTGYPAGYSSGQSQAITSAVLASAERTLAADVENPGTFQMSAQERHRVVTLAVRPVAEAGFVDFSAAIDITSAMASTVLTDVDFVDIEAALDMISTTAAALAVESPTFVDLAAAVAFTSTTAATLTVVVPATVGGPSVTSLSVAKGPTTGGTTVVVAGIGFTGATAVSFGGTAAVFSVDADTQITATSPARAAGTVKVEVVTSVGTSPDVAEDDFTYGPPPAVSSVSPTSGPVGGGVLVTITGSGFTETFSVRFGDLEAQSFTVDSDTQIRARSPRHSSGTVGVTVETPYGVAT